MPSTKSPKGPSPAGRVPGTARALAYAVLERCARCGVLGPRARLAEHLRADHGLSEGPPNTIVSPAVGIKPYRRLFGG